MLEKLQREVAVAIERKEDYSVEEASQIIDRLCLMTSEDDVPTKKSRKREADHLSPNSVKKEEDIFIELSEKKLKVEDLKTLAKNGIVPFQEK